MAFLNTKSLIFRFHFKHRKPLFDSSQYLVATTPLKRSQWTEISYSYKYLPPLVIARPGKQFVETVDDKQNNSSFLQKSSSNNGSHRYCVQVGLTSDLYFRSGVCSQCFRF
ncbi:unnamed protein product [Allacma fusca]|uniref:Uncharacterized protein n=1 Tax=Allacma fusca TaxID=39272 RepID=A0A8J2JAB5_9HEXA|nr:unnamed protein product [Allacma fusca]